MFLESSEKWGLGGAMHCTPVSSDTGPGGDKKDRGEDDEGPEGDEVSEGSPARA
jgi:hypothetical protein